MTTGGQFQDSSSTKTDEKRVGCLVPHIVVAWDPVGWLVLRTPNSTATQHPTHLHFLFGEVVFPTEQEQMEPGKLMES